jgi:hypothetical protein
MSCVPSAPWKARRYFIVRQKLACVYFEAGRRSAAKRLSKAKRGVLNRANWIKPPGRCMRPGMLHEAWQA